MFELILATLLSFLTANSSLIGKRLSSFLNRLTKREKELILEKRNLKQQQSQISITDNFAKYSKIQRKINSIDEVLTECRRKRNNLYLHFSLNYGLKFLLGAFLFLLSLYYRYTPVIVLDEQIELFPFGNIVSYPNKGNVVSFHFWVLCCSTTARLIKI